MSTRRVHDTPCSECRRLSCADSYVRYVRTHECTREYTHSPGFAYDQRVAKVGAACLWPVEFEILWSAYYETCTRHEVEGICHACQTVQHAPQHVEYDVIAVHLLCLCGLN